jgi:hypothetical protein
MGLGSPLRGCGRVQASENPVEERDRSSFFSSGVVRGEDFAFKAPKPVRQSRITFAVPCQVGCYSMDTLGLGIPHAGLVLLVRGDFFADENNQNTRLHRSFIYFIICLYDAT